MQPGPVTRRVAGLQGRSLAGVWLLLATLGCGTAGQHHAAGGGAATAGAATGGAATGGVMTGGAATATDPGRKDMHRLNSTEYNATIQDVLGATLQPANDSWRGGELGGFDNIASVLGIDEAQYERYRSAAQALATELLASEKPRARFVSCELSDAACSRTTIAAAGLRLFRRPLEPDELQTYQRVYDAARALG